MGCLAVRVGDLSSLLLASGAGRCLHFCSPGFPSYSSKRQSNTPPARLEKLQMPLLPPNQLRKQALQSLSRKKRIAMRSHPFKELVVVLCDIVGSA